MSDLHCHKEDKKRATQDSHLLVGSLRRLRGRHPVQALLDLIELEKLHADVLLVPGDLANKADQEGLSQAWELVLEVGKALNCKKVIPVLGNHDVESRRAGRGSDREAVYLAKNLRPGFPFAKDEDCARFFSDGCCVIELAEQVELVAINSVIGHTDEASAKRGTFGTDRIDRLREVLREQMKAPLRLAMLHHHPILHSGPFSPDRDVLLTGDVLLSALKDHDCRFIIHGHKHLARLRKSDNVTVFAAGSFAALWNDYGKSMGNLFHLVDIEHGSTVASDLRGVIRSWTFLAGTGWDKSHHVFCGFPFRTGFGAAASVDQIRDAVSQLVASQPTSSFIPESEILRVAPDVQFLMPEDFDDLQDRLKDLKLKFYEYDSGNFHLGKII